MSLLPDKKLFQRSRHGRFASLFAITVVLAIVAPSAVANAAVASKVPQLATRLYVGEELRVGQRLTSSSGVFAAVLLPGGRIEIEKSGRVVWTSDSGTGLSSILNREVNGEVEIAAHRVSEHVSSTTSASQPSYLTVENSGDVALISRSGVTLWQGGVKAHVSGAPTVAPYTPGELYGDSNPSAKCYTCDAANITGSAPPSNTLDSGTDVDAMTGDFSTSNTLFDAPAIAGDLTISLGYDAELAQAELNAGVTSGSDPFGVGWNSNFNDSVTPGTDAYGVSDVTVNQGNGSELVFTDSNDWGTSTSCQESGDPTTYAAAYAGDYPFTSKYTISGSSYNFCALASVQGQLSEVSSTGFTYQENGGQEIQDFAWNGELEETTTAAASSGTSAAGLNFYGVSAGSTSAGGHTLTEACPSTASYGCSIIYSSDGRDIVEVLNSVSQVTSIIAPSGATYSLTYSPANTVTSNLVSIAEPSPTGSSTATWNYVYSSASSPYSSDITEIEDPDYSASTSTYAHTTTINYDSSSSSTPGMVSSLVDGSGTSTSSPGATTTYSYSEPCSTGQCTEAGASQTTTIDYPAQVLCSGSDTGCEATPPVEIDQYTAGLETSTELGSLNSPLEEETWTYGWDLGNGVANTTEVVTYPDALNLAQSSAWVAPTATIVSDPVGNVISTTNALGDTATSEYNDVGSNDLNELLWSFPGPTSNTTTPPTGASVETYNSYGQVVTATDPLGNVTSYGYYGNYSLLCYVAPPSVSAANGWTATSSSQPPSCTSSPTSSSPNTSVPTGAPVGATTYAYDNDGDVTSTIVDAGDTSAGADPQTTTADFDSMDNELWTVPPAGQGYTSCSGGGAQCSTNPFATSITYVTGTSLPSVITEPDGMSTTDTYDLAGNLTSTGNENDSSMYMFTTTVYDGDNRPCYQLQGEGSYGSSCSASSQAGSTQWTYEPGSTNVATKTDSYGNTTTYYYGDLAFPNEPTEIVDPTGGEIQYSAYDDYGNACVTGDTQTLSSFPTSSSSLPLGNADQCIALSGDTTTAYNPLGSATSVTDPSGNVTTNVYANSSYPTLVTSTKNSAGATTSYLYDADGNLLTTYNPDGTDVGYFYNANGELCSKAPTAYPHICGEGPSKAGVTQYSYNDAGDLISMSDNTANPATPTQWSQQTTYSYTDGQLLSTTDDNGKTVSYQYNDAGQVSCIAYPVSTSATCSSPSSSTNTTVTRTYDSEGRLSTETDWLGNTTTYAYTDYWTPYSPTSITYPTATGVTASYGYSHTGNVASLSASSTVTSGTAISDSWTQNSDEQVATSSINGSTSSTESYNGDAQVTHAANLATSTSDDVFTIAANGEITNDAPPTGSSSSYAYNSGEELCSVNTSASASCTSNPSNGTVYSYTTNGERVSATPYSGGTAGSTTYYNWNAEGELCSTGPTAVTPTTNTEYSGCTATSGDTNYQYNGNGQRMSAATSTATTDFTWDNVSGGRTPLDINDATTTSSGTTNTSYLYGNLLFGGTAPIEQITTTSSGAAVSYLVSNQAGVQGVYNGSGSSLGAVQEMAVYSVYGNQTITSGSKVTTFGFQGSYTDPTGLIYLINRYYDPTTDQFLSIDPDVATTDQPYVFTNDDPLNATDPLGLYCIKPGPNHTCLKASKGDTEYDTTRSCPSGVYNGNGSCAKASKCNESLYESTGSCTPGGPDVYANGAPSWPSTVIDGIGGALFCGSGLGTAVCIGGLLTITAKDVGSDIENGCSSGKTATDAGIGLASAGLGAATQLGAAALEGASAWIHGIYDVTTGAPSAGTAALQARSHSNC